MVYRLHKYTFLSFHMQDLETHDFLILPFFAPYFPSLFFRKMPKFLDIFSSKSANSSNSANKKARQTHSANEKPIHNGDAEQIASDTTKVDLKADVKADVTAKAV